MGVPHTPLFPMQVAREGPDSPTGKLFAEVRRHLEGLEPEVLVVFDSDHLNTFFLYNLPTFAVGVAESTWGPNDATPGWSAARSRSTWTPRPASTRTWSPRAWTRPARSGSRWTTRSWSRCTS